MSLIATAPAATQDAPDGANVITNDGWFPDIDMLHVRKAVRLDGTVTDERLRGALVIAMAAINDDLRTFAGAHASLGVLTLADVLAPTIDGESINLARYRNAVYYTARADLVEKYRDFDSTKSGHQAADQLENTVDDDRRTARWAVRDILGVGRMTVELI